MAKKRVGVFGGTFDPPHLGHLLLAETIREDFQLDDVLFVPCNEAPHKDRQDLSSAAHRYAMVVAATLHNPNFSPSAVEVNRSGKSFSIETVRTLEEELGPDTEMFFVAGLDSFLQIQTWKSSEELLDLCHFVVVARPGSCFDNLSDALPARFHDRLVDMRGQHRGAGPGSIASSVGDGQPWRIFLSDAVYLEVSATDIRARVAAGRGVRYRVSPEVERYIQTHRLYQQPASAQEAVI